MKPHFVVLTCNPATQLSAEYDRLLRKTWGKDCVTLLYDSNHPQLAEEAKNLGWDVEVFDWDETIKDMNNPGWTHHYLETKRVVSPARRAAYFAARKRGVRYFMELDDDWKGIQIPGHISDQLPSRERRCCIKKEPEDFVISYFKTIVEKAFDLAAETGSVVAFVQSGEVLNGVNVENYHFKPKVMNTFILDAEKIIVGGGINEDVNIYCRRLIDKPCFQLGYLIWSHGGSQLNFRAGADYKGTWEKTYATVITNPTATKLSTYKNAGGAKDHDAMEYSRIHHCVQYEHTQPKHVWPVEEA